MELPEGTRPSDRPGTSPTPIVDDGTRRRLIGRFGPEIGSWLDEVPDVLRALAIAWHIEWDSLIPRGSFSVVIRCATGGQHAVLKISPDRVRIANEASALERWATSHVPSVLAADERLGALLIEAVEPGTPLIESLTYPKVETISTLVTSLFASGAHDPSYPPLARRVAELFDAGTKPYERQPELLNLIPMNLYERGRRLATRLAAKVPPTALLHGDLTPSNILDGGSDRGLVAVDPAPCLGDDLSFDAIDLLLWQADEVDTVASRAELLAPAIGTDPGRLFDWGVAFAAMLGVELAESPDSAQAHIRTCVALAAQAPK